MANPRSKQFAANFQTLPERKLAFLDPHLTLVRKKCVDLAAVMEAWLDDLEDVRDGETDPDFLGPVGELEMKLGALRDKSSNLRRAALDIQRVFREAEEISVRVAEVLKNG